MSRMAIKLSLTLWIAMPFIGGNKDIRINSCNIFPKALQIIKLSLMFFCSLSFSLRNSAIDASFVDSFQGRFWLFHVFLVLLGVQILRHGSIPFPDGKIPATFFPIFRWISCTGLRSLVYSILSEKFYLSNFMVWICCILPKWNFLKICIKGIVQV